MQKINQNFKNTKTIYAKKHKTINSLILNYLSTTKRLSDLDKKILCLDLGLIPYKDAFDIQTYFFNYIKDTGNIGIILLLEHTPVITIGNNSNSDNLITDKKNLMKQNIELFQSNRGGDITFHGPGQIICYPILNLSLLKKDLSLYVYNLEEIIIEVLKKYKIQSIRIPGYRGVFVQDQKIASIGIRIKKWITMHGFSLNVNVDLKYFDNIIACGLKNYPPTSMKKILNGQIVINDVKEQILENFKYIFKSPVLLLKF